MKGSHDTTRSERARETFAEALERLDRGERLDFESFFRERPELEVELRSLHGNWSKLERVFGGLAADFAADRDAGLATGVRSASGPSLQVRGLDDTTRSDIEALARPDRARSRYRKIETLAQGGMGVVWRVYDRDMQRELAMKRVRLAADGEAVSEGRLVRRFLFEARLAGRLDHPGILPVHDIGVDVAGDLYFTMPLVRGESLERVFERAIRGDGGWTLVRAIEVILRVCDAMECAHAANVVHRDLKPANVMVGRFGETYVMDWGLARSRAVDDQGDGVLADGEAIQSAGVETAHGAVLGTPAYMALEQATGGLVGPQSDVYALGAILYHLLVGRAPYATSDEARSGDDVLRALRAGPPVPVEKLAPNAPPELAAIAAKAMERSVAARYASVREMSEDLRAFVEGRVVRAHEVGAWPELKKWIRRNRRLALAIAGVLATAIGGLSWVSYVESSSKAEILRLSDVRRLVDLERRADELWPAVPARVPALQAWLVEARALWANRGVHEAALRAMSARRDAAPASSAHSVASDGEAWRRETLAGLLYDLDRFASGNGGTIASVERRIELARRIERESLVDAAAAWERAIASIADRNENPQYAGLAVRPQLGLVPIGRDPASGLWEFAHVASGTVPQRADDGSLSMRSGDAVVLVLIPGGTFAMGSQRPTPGQPSGPRTDPLARDDETPTRSVELAPFFLSKYEMTRAQWQRLAEALDPPTSDRASYPIDAISWIDTERVLKHAALAIPTEAQWEYGARAGSTTRWWCGNDASALTRVANAGSGIDASLPYADEFKDTAPVDSLAANAFGLHHVHGNVREWTLDAYAPTQSEAHRAGDGVALVGDSGLRTVRGGGYASSIVDTRSAARAGVPPENRDLEIGVRPARSLDP